VSLRRPEAVVHLLGLQNMGSTADEMLPSYTSEASCLRAAIARAWLMQANENPPTNAASTALKRFLGGSVSMFEDSGQA
jgi:hypothetical protein